MIKYFHKRAMILSLALATVLSGCTSGLSLPDEMAPTSIVNPAEGYLLEPGNRIRVTVFGEDGLTGEYSVDPVGNVSFPLIGNVPGAGVTSAALAVRVQETLRAKGLMRDPRVNVEVVTFRPFYVLGEVRQPGEFPYTTGMTVLGGVARAGGYDYRAREGEVILVRVVNGERLQYKATELTPLLPGDIVRVLERKF